jgi:diaminopimelate decarboxylase
MFNDPFQYRKGKLSCENVDLQSVAFQYGTPTYVYSKSAIESRFREYTTALEGIRSHVCFAVKANSNLTVLNTLVGMGAWFDIVSGGELYRVIRAGGFPADVVFSGVGKTAREIRYALEREISSFNCESEFEIELISKIATDMGRRASIAIRVNPDVDAVTHPYISTGLREHKFGVDIDAAEQIYQRASQLPGIDVTGVSCHIGSQLLDVEPMLEAADKTLALVAKLRAQGLPIRHLDLGGGLGVSYRQGDDPMAVSELIDQLRPRLHNTDLTLMLEPGRSIVAEAGILLTRVLLVKKNGEKTFVIVDGGMNDLIRPALYQAYHEIVPVLEPATEESFTADIVGPVCESGDFFARGRSMPPLEPGALLAIRTAGAYGFVLASNYNSRPRACELMIDGTQVVVARQRESYEDLIRGEQCILD